MRRNIRRHEVNLFQLASLTGGLRQRDVAAMDRVKGSAEYSDIHGFRSGTDVSFMVFLWLLQVFVPWKQHNSYFPQGAMVV